MTNGAGEVTVDGTVTLMPGAKRQAVYLEVVELVTDKLHKQGMSTRGMRSTFFSLEPNDLFSIVELVDTDGSVA